MATQGLPPVSPEDKKVNTIISVIAIIIAIGFAVYSWQVLPAQVTNQLGAFKTGTPAIPKVIAVLLPFGISTFSAMSAIEYRKQFLVCLIGYAMNVLFLISN